MPTAAPTKPRKSHRFAASTLVVVGTICAFLAISALWINRQVLNTENWTQSSSKLLENKAIRTALSGYLVDQLYANVDVAGEIRAALPPQAKPIAPAAAGALRNVAEDVTNRLLQRPRVQSLWEAANRAAHTTFLKIVDGGGPAVSTANGVVKLDLAGVLQQLADRVGASGNLVAKIPPGAAELTVLRSNQLKTAQDVARVLRALPIVLLALVLLLYGGAIALARERRRETVRAVGFGFVVAGALALVARSVGGDALVNSLGTTETVRPAIAAVFRIDTELLVEAATAAIAYGIVLIVGAWLAGTTRAAVATRRGLAPYLRQPGYAWGGAAAIVLIVLAWGPTPATRHFVPALLLTALFALGVEALRRQTAREFPGAMAPELGVSFRSGYERLRSAGGNGHAPHGNGAAHNGGDASAPSTDPLARLERIADLHDRGALSDDEFAERKQEILAAG